VILKKVCINDKIILHQNPIWPKIDDGVKIDYRHRLSYNEDYPETASEDRIILDEIKVINSKKDTIEFISKIIDDHR